MATLQQMSERSAIFIGWYGTCYDGQCQNFSLSGENRVYIEKVYQTSNLLNNDGYVAFDGSIDSVYDDSLQPFVELECGKSRI